MISSLSFLYLRSWAGDSDWFLSLFSMSWSCRRRSRLVAVGDVVEGLKHLGLEFGLNRRKRHGALEIVFIEFALGRIDRLRFAGQDLGLGAKRRRGSGSGGGSGRLRRLQLLAVGCRAIAGRHGGHALCVRARIGGFQIDDVA